MSRKLFKFTTIISFLGIFITIVLLTYWAHLINALFLTEKCDKFSTLSKHLIQNPITYTEYEFLKPELTYLGRFKITYYCACAKCCGKSDGITASGAHVKENHTIAVDPEIIPLGSQVLINGIVYTAEDTGSSINEQRIDIYVPTHEEALQKGVDYADIYVLTKE